MPLSTAGPLGYLFTLLQGLTGVQVVYEGVPSNIGNRMAAYIGLGGQKYHRLADSVMDREASYFVCFAYKVEGAPANAETTIAGLLDQFLQALANDLTLGGTAKKTEVDASLANQPKYHFYDAVEFRVFPVLVTARQYGSFTAVLS